MQPSTRSSSRVLSSLKDLRIDSEKLTKIHEAVRRPSKKNYIIMGDSLEEDSFYQNFTLLPREKTSQILQFLRNCLSHHFVFRELVHDQQLVGDLLAKFFCCTLKKGELIMKQGDNASCFFVLEKGSLNVIIDGLHRREIQEGQGFGQLALLYNAARSASVEACQDCILWSIDRRTFRKVVSEICQKQSVQNREFIDKVKFFEYLTPRQKDCVANGLMVQRYKPGTNIVIQGDLASSFFIVKEGVVRVICNGQEVGQLTEGQYFGEAALISTSQPRNATVQAATDCVVLAMARESIRAILGPGIHTIVYRNKLVESMAKSSIFSCLDPLVLEKLADQMIISKLPAGAIIVQKQSPMANRIFFILEGDIEKNLSHTQIDVEQPYKIHGQQSLSSSTYESRYTHTMKFIEGGAIAYCTRQDMLNVFGSTYEKAVEKNTIHDNFIKNFNKDAQMLRQSCQNDTLANLKLLKKIGCGQFGIVFLCELRQKYYALKCIDRVQIEECKLERQLAHEKEVLQLCQHPFLVQYCRSFKDDRNIYFLMEFINGMQLFEAIREIGLLDGKSSRFYIGSIILALQYLQQHNVIYRDLKPENIIVDREGYARLIDMGTCKYLSTCSTKTFTIIGTPHYMAPEVLAGKGYSFNVDLWSLGIMLYEFMSGFVPFGEDAEDPYEIYEQIVKNELKFPAYVKDPVAKDLIGQMLCKKQESRVANGFSSLKNHAWFHDFNWDDLLMRKLQAPYCIPKDKLINVSNIREKPTTVADEFPTQPTKQKKLKKVRKDFDPNWDMTF